MKRKKDPLKILILCLAVLAVILLGMVAAMRVLPGRMKDADGDILAADAEGAEKSSGKQPAESDQPGGKDFGPEDGPESEAKGKPEDVPEETSKDSSGRKDAEAAADIFSDPRLAAILEGMTLEEKVGQMILARCPGPSEAAYYAEEYQLGGYVLFDPDFSGYAAEEVREYIDECQAVSEIPMLMAVDEEGGTVTRVSDYYREEGCFMSPRDVFAEGGWEAIEADTAEKCELLLDLHLNMNLAPVADIAGDPQDFMYDRSFSGDPKLATEFVSTVVEIMNEYGVACSLKHFPGYGNNIDTHTGMATDERTKDSFFREDLAPFAAGIEAGAGSIMISHNVVDCFDDEYPASLSPDLHELARSMGFEGVLITDDMAMGAITDYCGTEEAAVLAVLAGNDLLITSDFVTQYEAILTAVEEGVIEENCIDVSVMRILKLKKDMGLL